MRHQKSSFRKCDLIISWFWTDAALVCVCLFYNLLVSKQQTVALFNVRTLTHNSKWTHNQIIKPKFKNLLLILFNCVNAAAFVHTTTTKTNSTATASQIKSICALHLGHSHYWILTERIWRVRVACCRWCELKIKLLRNDDMNEILWVCFHPIRFLLHMYIVHSVYIGKKTERK